MKQIYIYINITQNYVVHKIKNKSNFSLTRFTKQHQFSLSTIWGRLQKYKLKGFLSTFIVTFLP